VITEVFRRISTVRRVDDQDFSGIGFLFLSLGFIREILLPIPMELVPPVSGVVLYCIFWTVIVLYYYYYFIYSVFDLFYSFSLSYTHLVVRTWRD
jgi:hypothetical protein